MNKASFIAAKAKSKILLRDDAELEKSKDMDSSTDSNDEEKPEPKAPVKPVKKDENEEAEDEIKKAEIDELNKKEEKKAKAKKAEADANKFDGTVHKGGKRFFTDGTEVDGVNDWISNTKKMFRLGKEKVRIENYEEEELPKPVKRKAPMSMAKLKSLAKDSNTSPIVELDKSQIPVNKPLINPKVK